MTGRDSHGLDQPMLWPGLDPDAVIAEAVEQHRPVASFCLFSGGNDSSVLAHRCRDAYEALVFIDTGTAVPGVREHVEFFARWIDKPLRVFENEPGAYRHIVIERGNGFPGPAQHQVAYTYLKRRHIDRLVREAKEWHSRRAKVMLLTGTRRDESSRRMATTRAPYRTEGGKLWVSPLIDWTNGQMRAYRAEHSIPESDVAALLHRSGECNCGAFADPSERDELCALWPEWWDGLIGALEREAKGKPSPRWAPGSHKPVEDPGELCSSCQLRMAA